MAETEVNTSTLKRNFLSCALCLEEYKDPRCLDCLHSFCRLCLEDYASRNHIRPGNAVKCPLCRVATKVPKDGVKKLRSNFLLTGLAEYDSKKVQDKKPKELEFENEASDMKFSSCPDHKLRCELFCQCTECLRPICLQCLATNHKGHLVTTVSEQAAEQHNRLLEVQQQLAKSKEATISLIRQGAAVVKAASARGTEVEAQYKELEETLQDLLTKVGCLKKEAKAKTDACVLAAKTRISALEGRVKSIDHTDEVVEEIVSMASEEDLILVGSLVHQGATQLVVDTQEEQDWPSWTVNGCGKVATDATPLIGFKDIMDSTLVLKDKLESTGSTPEEVNVPSESAPAVEDRAEGAEASKSSKWMLKPAGTFQCQVSDDSEQPVIVDMCYGPDGHLALADYRNGKVKLFTSTGKLRWSSRFRFPSNITSITWWADRNVFLLVAPEAGFFSISMDGVITPCTELSEGMTNPFAVTINDQGDLVVLGEPDDEKGCMKICLLDKDSAEIKHSWPVSKQCVFVGTSGDRIIVSANTANKIAAYASSGELLWEYTGEKQGQTKLRYPWGVCSNREGHIFVAAEGTHGIHVLSPEGDQLAHLGLGGLFGPCSIAEGEPNFLALRRIGSSDILVFEYTPVTQL